MLRPAGARCLALAALLLAVACSSGEPAPETVRGTLGDVELVLEVADEPEEQARGLMQRDVVPSGTGMIFTFDEPTSVRFYMFQVRVPLRAVFLRRGRVVGSVLMPPCRADRPGECPTYGVDQPYDTVVETAPETLPGVQPGDVLRLD